MWSSLVLLLLSFICVRAEPLPRVSVDAAGRFRDPAGRQLLFHGFNRVLKEFPWYDARLLNKTRLDFYKKWGFNAARIGCMWSGVAPKKGYYNETYLNITMETVKTLGDHGIYSLLDMHQDVISSALGSYDGVPLWIIESFPKDTPAYPFPLTKDIIKLNWGLGYLTMAVASAFQHLYKNTSGAIDRWGDFWAKVANKFKRESSVIGYELINEPFAGNFYKNFELLLPGVAGSLNLLPAYDQLVSRIRAVDNDTLVFYEPVTWGVYDSSAGKLGPGFSRVPGGDSQRLKSVLSYHYYCWIIGNASLPYTTLEKVVCDDLLAPSVFPSVVKDIARTGGGAFLSEFGLCQPDGNPKSKNTLECELVMSLADQYLQSWTYWDSRFFDANGDPNMVDVRPFVRAYPRAVAGNLTALRFDVNSGELRFSFDMSMGVKAQTEVFLPTTVHYPKGFNVMVSPALKYSFDAEKSVLLISKESTTGLHIKDGQPVKVRITAK